MALGGVREGAGRKKGSTTGGTGYKRKSSYFLYQGTGS